MFSLAAAVFSLVLAVRAVPVAHESRAAVTHITGNQLSAFTPFTHFAQAAYCPSDTVKDWSCNACKELSGFNLTLIGGTDDSDETFFVGFWPQEQSVVVAHEGTDPTKIESIVTDISFKPEPLNTTLFPGLPDDVAGHTGFLAEQAKHADEILAEVKKLIAEHTTTKVTLVGHSLGGAVAEIESLFLKLNLPQGTTIKAVTYGTPRVGNQAYADFFDSQNIDFRRINNEDDLVPILPGRFLGFVHPSGETHLLSDTEGVDCPGQDDATDADCTIKSVPNILDGNILNHLGPYVGQQIGTIFC